MNDIIGKLVEGNKAAIALATEEYLEIHRLLDKAGIPRKAFDEPMSASQRVKSLVDSWRLIHGEPVL